MWIFEGSASGLKTIRCTDGRLGQLRERVSIYLGDWEAEVKVVDIEAPPPQYIAGPGDGMRWVETVDAARYAPPESPDTTAADLLWEALNFGELYWRWPVRFDAPRAGVRAISADDGAEFIPRVWRKVPPTATAVEINGPVRADVLAAIDALPAGAVHCVPKAEWKRQVNDDLDELVDWMCAKGAASFGEAAFPGASDRVVRIKTYFWDGNDRIAAFSTATRHYLVNARTS